MAKQKMPDENSLFRIIRDTLKYEPVPDFPIGLDAMDDCALLRIDDKMSMAISTDFVRGSGFSLFKLGLMNYFDVGYYLISANLSDLASTGAKPSGLTTVIRYADMDASDFEQVFKGMKASADVHNTPIIGGDIGSYTADVFAATVFGVVPTDKALLRRNAKKGDLLCVTGIVGRAFTALLYFAKCKQIGHTLSEEFEREILLAWQRPQARIQEGLLLSSGFSKCCQDISDGLKATVEQISQQSHVGFTLFEEKIPIHASTVELGKMLGIDPLEIAFSASVDFELLFTIDREIEAECVEAFKKKGLKFSVIGEVNDLQKNYVRRSNGLQTALPGMPFDQRPIQEIIQAVLSAKD